MLVLRHAASLWAKVFPALAFLAILTGPPGHGKPASAQSSVFTSMVGDQIVIFLLGDITDRSRVEILPLLHAYPGATVVLEGPGGLVSPGLAIGRAIRAARAKTLVPSGGLCASTCAFIWLAGSERGLGDDGARLGFHGVFTRRGSQVTVSGPGNALVGAYLRELGLSDRSIERLTEELPHSMAWLTRPELSELEIELASIPLLPPRSRPAQRGVDGYSALHGLWEGEMACGELRHIVRVLVWRDAADAIAATVELGPGADSYAVGHAVFNMRGVRETTGGFRFTGNQRFPNSIPDPPLLLSAGQRGGSALAHIRAGPTCLPFPLRRPASQ
jgi:hypothetical protein